MDYALYSIVTKTNVAKNLEASMRKHMLFLGKAYSDTWIDERFDKDITDDQVTGFKHSWVSRFKRDRLSCVWLCTDGSNDDCNADIPQAEKGKAKSRKNTNLVSFLYTVTEDGTPVFSKVNRGGKVDSTAFQEQIRKLKEFELMPKGVILDRGFCKSKTIREMQDKRFDFVIKLIESTKGFKKLLSDFGHKIKYKWDYALGNRMYGTGEKVQVFTSDKLQAHCVLVWDARNGGQRIDCFVDGLQDAIAQAEESINQGLVPSVPDKYKNYLEVKDNNGRVELSVNTELIQSEMDNKGFFGLLCSKPYSAKEAINIYNIRDSSETQYSIMKTQLGYNVFRVQQWHRIEVREAIAFTASIIRNEMLKVCKTNKKDLNKVIQELEMMTLNLSAAGSYSFNFDELMGKQKDILDMFGLTQEMLSNIAEYETKRVRGETVNPIQTLKLAKKDSPKSTTEVKKTVINDLPPDSKARGKGAKSKLNSTTTDDTTPTSAPAQGVDGDTNDNGGTTKRKRGRPLGSKNRPKNQNAPIEPKHRGRPKGSKNKPRVSDNSKA